MAPPVLTCYRGELTPSAAYELQCFKNYGVALVTVWWIFHDEPARAILGGENPRDFDTQFSSRPFARPTE
jgi:hypothetical protein